MAFTLVEAYGSRYKVWGQGEGFGSLVRSGYISEFSQTYKLVAIHTYSYSFIYIYVYALFTCISCLSYSPWTGESSSQQIHEKIKGRPYFIYLNLETTYLVIVFRCSISFFLACFWMERIAWNIGRMNELADEPQGIGLDGGCSLW